MENLKQGLRVAKATLDKAKQDARSIPVQNPLNQEILRLAVEEYQEAYDEAVKQLPLTEERQLADLKLYELSYEYDVRHRNRHRAGLPPLHHRSPDGRHGRDADHLPRRRNEPDQGRRPALARPALHGRGGPQQHAVGRHDEPGRKRTGPARPARHGALRRLPGYRGQGPRAGRRRLRYGRTPRELLRAPHPRPRQTREPRFDASSPTFPPAPTCSPRSPPAA